MIGRLPAMLSEVTRSRPVVPFLREADMSGASRYVLISIALLLILGVSASAQCVRCGPGLSISPRSLTFSAQHVGTKSAPMYIILRGLGGITPVRFSGFSTTGPFSQTNNCPATLSLNRVCSIQVFFVPKSVGIVHGSVVIHDNISPGQQLVPLSGTGQ
jgi:hypothetical protein